MPGNFLCYYCRLLTFFKINFFKKAFRNTIRVSNILDPDQARRFVGSYLGLNCLQRLPAGDTSRQIHVVAINSSHARVIFFMLLLSSADFFQNLLFQNKSFRNTIRVSNSFGSRSGPTFCRALSGSKLFANVSSRRHS